MKSFNPIEIMMAADRAQSIFIFVLCMVTLLCIVLYRDARKERNEIKRRVR